MVDSRRYGDHAPLMEGLPSDVHPPTKTIHRLSRLGKLGINTTITEMKNKETMKDVDGGRWGVCGGVCGGVAKALC